MHEGKRLTGIHVYLLDLKKNTYTWSKNMKIGKTSIMRESSKLEWKASGPTHPPSRHHPSHVLWEPAPTSNTKGGDFGTHFLLGPRGLALKGTQTFLLAKFKGLILS